jgi:hypothetical protein
VGQHLEQRASNETNQNDEIVSPNVKKELEPGR